MESDGPYCVINDETTGVVGPGLCADGEYVNGLEEAGRRCESLNTAYVEGRKSMEKEIEEKKAIKDALLCGTGFVMEGKRVPPEDVYLSETEIKLQKVEKKFKELLSIAEMMCADIDYGSDGTAAFVDWKKARGIE